MLDEFNVAAGHFYILWFYLFCSSEGTFSGLLRLCCVCCYRIPYSFTYTVLTFVNVLIVIST